jgi:hypothetical protein
MLFFSPLMTTVEEAYLNYIYLEPINTLEEQNDRIHEALATVILNMTGRGKFNKTSSPIPSDER